MGAWTVTWRMRPLPPPASQKIEAWRWPASGVPSALLPVNTSAPSLKLCSASLTFSATGNATVRGGPWLAAM